MLSTLDRDSALAVLQSNHGFDGEDLDRWVSVAQRESFQRRPVIKVTHCPDCGKPPGSVVGRYVSFSNLISLHECPCGLLWANARMDADTTSWWFEAHAYFSAEYYAKERAAVFDQLFTEMCWRLPLGARVLDVGGAGGQFAARLRRGRPDLQITVQDVSATKIHQAMTQGFYGIVGDQWMHEIERYDAIVLCDSIYYEPNLPALWNAIERSLKPGGYLFIRVPNRVPVMRLAGLRQRLSREPETRLAGHNPDHLVVCTPRYLERKVREFALKFWWVPSTPGEGGQKLARAYRWMQRIHWLTGRRLTPSHLFIGRRPYAK